MTDLPTVAKNLRDIEDMALRLEVRAQDQGRRVSRDGDRGIPGGEAMVNLASVGSLETWNRRVDLRERVGDYATGEHEDPDDMWPAVQVLWYWSEDYRNQLGHDLDDPRWRPSLVSEAKFLRNHDVAEWIWNNEPKWDHYASDVSLAKRKLETILHAGSRAERIRVVCPDCDAAKPLIRVFSDRDHVANECPDCAALYDPDQPVCAVCEIVLEPVYNSDPDDDRWKCPECRHKFTREEVDQAHTKQMRSQGVERWVPINDALSLMRSQGWQERTVLDWFESGDLELSQDSAGRRSVWWPDVWRTHNAARQRREIAAKKAIDLRLRKWICKVEHGEDCWIKYRGCSEMLKQMTAV